MAHITGGGLPGNLPRTLPPDLDAVVRRGTWSERRLFAEIATAGGVSPDEMLRVFNLGIGMVLAVDPDAVAGALSALGGFGHEPVIIGHLQPGQGRVLVVATD